MNDITARADALGNPPSKPSDVLRGLADRCEREEPSRALDTAIALAVIPNAKQSGLGPSLLRIGLSTRYADRYTTSLDAAVTLVPEGWAWFVEWIGKPFSEGRARLWIPGQRTQKLAVENVNTQAKTPTMALCAAALRARAAVLEEKK